MAATFELRPGERVNEADLARKLGVSRTPLREALNRLESDGYVTRARNTGFFRKPLSVEEIAELYELREHLSRAVARLAVKKASDIALDAVETFLNGFPEPATPEDIFEIDEQFHLRLVKLAGNRELAQTLADLSGRIRYVREINLAGRRERLRAEYRAILRALRARDAGAAERLMAGQVALPSDEIVQMVREAYARIYVGSSPHLPAARRQAG